MSGRGDVLGSGTKTPRYVKLAVSGLFSDPKRWLDQGCMILLVIGSTILNFGTGVFSVTSGRSSSQQVCPVGYTAMDCHFNIYIYIYRKKPFV